MEDKDLVPYPMNPLSVTTAMPSHPKSLATRPAPPLPSAFDAFSEVAGTPDFLNCISGSAASEYGEDGRRRRGGGRLDRKEKRDLPSGAVLEARPQLVAIRDRVTTDNGTQLLAPIPSVDGKRVISATNPEPKDATDFLRMCLQCGIPKTYSNASGMVYPQCGDRPPTLLIRKRKKDPQLRIRRRVRE